MHAWPPKTYAVLGAIASQQAALACNVECGRIPPVHLPACQLTRVLFCSVWRQVALTRKDEYGRILTPKEAFRQLCYR